MKTLDEVITEMEGMEFIGTLADALEYLKRYKADLAKKCSNCKCWYGHENYDPNDSWREEYYCSYEIWTYPDDSCSKWEEME